MCNLNIIIKKEETTKKRKDLIRLIDFLNKTTQNSYQYNRDGDGLYTKDLLIKRQKKINLFQYYKQIQKSNIIITHQRLATSGFHKRYTQPFENKKFILAHNGIINDFLPKEGSDTYGFFQKFTQQFNQNIGKREEKITQAIKKLLDKLQYGSYSIILLDKKTENIYYFKDNNTNIHYYQNKNITYITTLKDNEKYLKNLKEKFKEIPIKNYTIYKIKTNNKITIKNIGQIQKPEIKTIQQYNYPMYEENLFEYI